MPADLRLRSTAFALLCPQASRAPWRRGRRRRRGRRARPSARCCCAARGAVRRLAGRRRAVQSAAGVCAADATSEVAALRKSVAGGEAVPSFGAKADELIADALDKFESDAPKGDSETAAIYGAKAEELRAAVETSLEPVFAQQICLLKDAAMEQFKKGLLGDGDGSEALVAAEAACVREATASVPSKTGWSYKLERQSLVGAMQAILSEQKKAQAAKLQTAADADRAPTCMQSQQMQARRRVLVGRAASGTSARRTGRRHEHQPVGGVPAGAVQRAGLMVPDEGANPRPQRLTQGVGLANLGSPSTSTSEAAAPCDAAMARGARSRRPAGRPRGGGGRDAGRRGDGRALQRRVMFVYCVTVAPLRPQASRRGSARTSGTGVAGGGRGIGDKWNNFGLGIYARGRSAAYAILNDTPPLGPLARLAGARAESSIIRDSTVPRCDIDGGRNARSRQIHRHTASSQRPRARGAGRMLSPVRRTPSSARNDYPTAPRANVALCIPCAVHLARSGAPRLAVAAVPTAVTASSCIVECPPGLRRLIRPGSAAHGASRHSGARSYRRGW